MAELKKETGIRSQGREPTVDLDIQHPQLFRLVQTFRPLLLSSDHPQSV